MAPISENSFEEKNELRGRSRTKKDRNKKSKSKQNSSSLEERLLSEHKPIEQNDKVTCKDCFPVWSNARKKVICKRCAMNDGMKEEDLK